MIKINRNQILANSFTRHCFVCSIRFKSARFKQNMAKVKQMKSPTMLAMDHFDFYYAPLFGKKWPSIRLGLLTPNKYIAVLNRFSKDYEVIFEFIKKI